VLTATCIAGWVGLLGGWKSRQSEGCNWRGDTENEEEGRGVGRRARETERKRERERDRMGWE
jgi:hypothetical protein